jgi:hypothetical protein
MSNTKVAESPPEFDQYSDEYCTEMSNVADYSHVPPDRLP